MSDPATTNTPNPETQSADSTESFGEIFSAYQKSHSHKTEGGKQLEGTVIAVIAESVFFDIG